MNQTIPSGALVLAGLLFSMGSAQADTAETKGGLTVRSGDGSFEFRLNGRIHYDAYAYGDDAVDANGGTFFRRTRLTLSGKAYDWEYKFEEDFTSPGADGYREMWIATGIGPGKLHIGQMKPPRSMEELTSSNDITFMERPFSSASGLFSGRQFQMGLFYLGNTDSVGYGLSAYNLASNVASAPATEGVGATGRLYLAPVTGPTTVHVGVSASQEMFEEATSGGPGNVRYAGRLSPRINLGTSGASGEDVTTVQGELGFAAGPITLQGEYAQQTLGQDVAPDQDVVSYYVQASVMVTGESRPYDVKKGVFKSPKPTGPAGAWELAVRYDTIKNEDSAIEPEITTLIGGVNWYVNPVVRFMLNAGFPQAETTVLGSDEPSFVSLRTQLAF